MLVVQAIAVIGCGYLLGAIPFAVVVARVYGVNILVVGSGNPGATNVKRVLGSVAGNLVFVLDVLKGGVATGWPVLFFDQNTIIWGVVGLVAAVLGHSCSVFIQFRGGKGVATALGGLVVLMPAAVLIGLFLWLVVFYTTRYSSLASIVLGLSFPVSAYCLHSPLLLQGVAVFLASFILIRHRANISRLIQGTENRFR